MAALLGLSFFFFFFFSVLVFATVTLWIVNRVRAKVYVRDYIPLQRTDSEEPVNHIRWWFC